MDIDHFTFSKDNYEFAQSIPYIGDGKPIALLRHRETGALYYLQQEEYELAITAAEGTPLSDSAAPAACKSVD